MSENARPSIPGLLGGIGPFATARYYTEIVAECETRGGGCPEIVILSLDFEQFTEREKSPDRGPYMAHILSGLERLSSAGAQFAAMAANSPHVVLSQIRERSPLPIVSIVDPVVREIRGSGVGSVLVLGIRATVDGELYARELEALEIEVLSPSEADQARIDATVFQELGRGLVRAASRERLLEIVDRSFAEAVLLACTELPLLLHPDSAAVPIFDSLALHVGAIVDEMLRPARGDEQIASEGPSVPPR